jgi:hypothetical protein
VTEVLWAAFELPNIAVSRDYEEDEEEAAASPYTAMIKTI